MSPTSSISTVSAKKSWTAKEESRVKLSARLGLSWKITQLLLPDRTRDAIQQRTYLLRKSGELEPASESRKRQQESRLRWSAEEDEWLLATGPPEKRIQKKLRNRTEYAARTRYRKLMRSREKSRSQTSQTEHDANSNGASSMEPEEISNNPGNAHKGPLPKRQWTMEEDERIIRMWFDLNDPEDIHKVMPHWPAVQIRRRINAIQQEHTELFVKVRDEHMLHDPERRSTS
ncbi:hypothetical protein EJ04DRAFT_525924 [Polyplosphaeria fusca]|uniref:Myb-like domain-containing protein n=1 Tax=Polyplosphaeria fusca TaxID=682080 RepID=A0A9P4UYT7_9PLEO|nr:hypothetical protein EJ04DRAFT_525924 [Polyplosphaeria fusca]